MGFPGQGELAYLRSLRQENPDLTILVSVGGWLWSTNFSDVSLTAQSRSIFVQSVMEFLKLYDLDGLDIDWEYPGMPGAGHPFRPEDKQNFTLLLKELRSKFDSETSRTHRKLYLTIAAGASDEFLAHTEMAKAQRFLDAVNLMAYDYYEPSSDAITGHHAPLFTKPCRSQKVSANTSVLAFEKEAFPRPNSYLDFPFTDTSGVRSLTTIMVYFNRGSQFQCLRAIPAIVETMLNHGFVRFWTLQLWFRIYTVRKSRSLSRTKT